MYTVEISISHFFDPNGVVVFESNSSELLSDFKLVPEAECCSVLVYRGGVWESASKIENALEMNSVNLLKLLPNPTHNKTPIKFRIIDTRTGKTYGELVTEVSGTTLYREEIEKYNSNILTAKNFDEEVLVNADSSVRISNKDFFVAYVFLFVVFLYFGFRLKDFVKCVVSNDKIRRLWEKVLEDGFRRYLLRE